MVLELGTELTKEEINKGNFEWKGSCNGFKVISKQRRYYFLNTTTIDLFNVAATVPKREYDEKCRKKPKGEQKKYRGS